MREHEGPLIGQGYVKPIYLMPMYHAHRLAAFSVRSAARTEGGQEYAEGLCPNTEHAHATIICHEMMRPPMTRADLDDVADAFEKVCGEIDALRAWERKAKP